MLVDSCAWCVRPGLHWTQLPTEFENTLAKHADEGALTFTAHFFEIGLWTFTGTSQRPLCRSVLLGF